MAGPAREPDGDGLQFLWGRAAASPGPLRVPERFSAGRCAFASRAVKTASGRRLYNSTCISHRFLPAPVRLKEFRGGEVGAGAAAAVVAEGGAAFGGREVLMPPPEAPAGLSGADGGVVVMESGRNKATMAASR